MERSLINQHERAELVARLHRLTPDSRRQWGRMTPHQAICHLSDSFRRMTGKDPLSPVRMVLGGR
jgi:hypothetical protein